MNSHYLLLMFLMLSCLANQCGAGPTAEQVLGEYWKDPLFGEAAADVSIPIELLSSKIWPETINVAADKNIRFVFHNKSDQFHLVAFSADVNGLLNDQAFQNFIKDEVSHSEKRLFSKISG